MSKYMANQGCGRLSSEVVGVVGLRISPVCTVALPRYLKIEPKVLWVDPSLWVDNSVFSNTKWKID